MGLWQRVLVVTLALGIVAAVLQFTGLLGPGYEWLWGHTTGRPYTSIMRDYPWLLLVPGSGIIAGLAKWLPRRYWARVVLIDVVLVVGFVAGHVFW